MILLINVQRNRHESFVNFCDAPAFLLYFYAICNLLEHSRHKTLVHDEQRKCLYRIAIPAIRTNS